MWALLCAALAGEPVYGVDLTDFAFPWLGVGDVFLDVKVQSHLRLTEAQRQELARLRAEVERVALRLRALGDDGELLSDRAWNAVESRGLEKPREFGRAALRIVGPAAFKEGRRLAAWARHVDLAFDSETSPRFPAEIDGRDIDLRVIPVRPRFDFCPENRIPPQEFEALAAVRNQAAKALMAADRQALQGMTGDAPAAAMQRHLLTGIGHGIGPFHVSELDGNDPFTSGYRLCTTLVAPELAGAFEMAADEQQRMAEILAEGWQRYFRAQQALSLLPLSPRRRIEERLSQSQRDFTDHTTDRMLAVVGRARAERIVALFAQSQAREDRLPGADAVHGTLAHRLGVTAKQVQQYYAKCQEPLEAWERLAAPHRKIKLPDDLSPQHRIHERRRRWEEILKTLPPKPTVPDQTEAGERALRESILWDSQKRQYAEWMAVRFPPEKVNQVKYLGNRYPAPPRDSVDCTGGWLWKEVP